MDDLLLIESIKQKDENALSLLIDKYHNQLFAFIYNITGNYETTEDLLQEVFFRMYKNIKKFDPEKASFKTWIYRVAQNHTYNYLKSASFKNTATSVELDLTYQASEENIEEEVVKNEQIELVLKVAKEVLKPKHFKIVQLHYFSNLTPKEISEVLDIPLKTIYKALESSIEKIRKEVT